MAYYGRYGRSGPFDQVTQANQDLQKYLQQQNDETRQALRTMENLIEKYERLQQIEVTNKEMIQTFAQELKQLSGQVQNAYSKMQTKFGPTERELEQSMASLYKQHEVMNKYSIPGTSKQEAQNFILTQDDISVQTRANYFLQCLQAESNVNQKFNFLIDILKQDERLFGKMVDASSELKTYVTTFLRNAQDLVETFTQL